MKHEEIVKALSLHFVQELTDVEKYLTLYEHSMHTDDIYLAKGLIEIAKDEYTHADFIKEILEENHLMLTDDVLKKWQDIEKKMDDMFS